VKIFERILAIFWLLFVALWVSDGLQQLTSNSEYFVVFAQTLALLSFVVCCSVLLWLQLSWRYALLLFVAFGGMVGFVIFLSNSQEFPLIDRAFGWFACTLSGVSVAAALFGLLRPTPR
jgi:hypothetical protein